MPRHRWSVLAMLASALAVLVEGFDWAPAARVTD